LEETAVLVMGVEPGGPAARAGLAEGDLIISVCDRPIASIDDLHAFLTLERIGLPLALEVLRDDERRSITIVPAEAQTAR
jgi:S1-C subfamily serine protease